eukprot:CAMPEP_0175285196 /NCGR_PEP_ID=MMETSP0093-20121207/53108_1 /TAXON_ID=311494 /ORGANISM="Alexandrium monilatum, Strain CCMP3105" /LENGTH=45 /DNA_ID= /DNA_START= /DNA_END= /DNA_ORIENTATION=
MAMAQPNTETPALRLLMGAPRPCRAAACTVGAALASTRARGCRAG